MFVKSFEFAYTGGVHSSASGVIQPQIFSTKYITVFLSAHHLC